MSKVTAYYHIVFCTKCRERTIPLQYKDDVYKFIWSEIRTLNCELLRIGGVDDHIHLLINLSPTIRLSELMQSVKSKSSSWMKSDIRFRHFKGWAAEYYACTISPAQKDSVINYIRTQEQHHLGKCFDDEIVDLYQYAGLNFDNRDLR